MPFIEQLSSPSPPPPAIYDSAEHNKENIPPFDFVNQFHLPNIIPEFDARFKTFSQYRNYRQRRLSSWMDDADFKVFDAAYCHHRLIIRQKEGLQTLIKQINTQLEELETQDACQKHNIDIVIPNLQAKGLAVRITDTLGRPDLVGTTPFSYPISAWDHKPTTPVVPPPPPVTPVRPPTPFIPEIKKKKRQFGEKCPKCRREYLYDHVAWARGYESGYTCRCPEEEETPSKPSTSSRPLLTNMEWPSLVHKPCVLCGTNPAHPRKYCLEYKCPFCHLYAPEHTPSQCKRRPRKTRKITKIKEEPVSPTPFNWEYDGYYDIEGYDDGNLNREN